MAALTLLLSLQSAVVDIARGLSRVEFEFGGQAFSIRRGAGGDAALPNRYCQATRTCPEHCVEPATAAPVVVTRSELEVFTFMQQNVSTGSGLLVDARFPAEFSGGSILGAISVPAATLVKNNPYHEDLLLALVVKGALSQMDFSSAFDLLVFDDSPWSPPAR